MLALAKMLLLKKNSKLFHYMYLFCGFPYSCVVFLVDV